MLLAGGLAGIAAAGMGWPLAGGLGGLIGDIEAAAVNGLAHAVDFPAAAMGGFTILGLAGTWLALAGFGVQRARLAGVLQWRPSPRAPALAPTKPVAVRRRERAAPEPAPYARPPPVEAPLAIRAPRAAPKPSGREGAPRSASALAAVRVRGRLLRLPELILLAKPKPRASAFDEASLRQNARVLEGVLAEFGVKGQIDQIRPGPVVTLYELVPAPGVKSARVVALCDDIARSMSVAACRVAVASGRNAIGIELPNAKRETVYLRDLLSSAEYEKTGPILPLALGETIGGEPYIADLARMPHLLIAGTTGSGKSVGVNAMILSILYRLTPRPVRRFIMIDPKMLELKRLRRRIPYLLAPRGNHRPPKHRRSWR